MFIPSKFNILGLSSRHKQLASRIKSESSDSLISIIYAKYNRGLNLGSYQIFVNFETLLSVFSVKFPLVRYRSAKYNSRQLFGFIEKLIGSQLKQYSVVFQKFFYMQIKTKPV